MAFTTPLFKLSILGKTLTRKTELSFFTKESKQYLSFTKAVLSKKKVSNCASFNSESILFLIQRVLEHYDFNKITISNDLNINICKAENDPRNV